MKNTFIANAKITLNGQVAIPKDVLLALGVTIGDYISFVVKGNSVRIANPCIYAMERLQKDMNGESLCSEEEIISLVKELRG